MVLILQIIAAEYPHRPAAFSWGQDTPSWISWYLKSLSLFFLANFIWFGVATAPGVPAIIDGQYVLDSHGRVLKTLTEAEYLCLKAVELRILASAMIYFYSSFMMYWLYRERYRIEARRQSSSAH
jgi:hypothetical protein